MAAHSLFVIGCILSLLMLRRNSGAQLDVGENIFVPSLRGFLSDSRFMDNMLRTFFPDMVAED